MSVSLTQGICGIVIDGLEIDTHPDSLLKNADGIVGEKATTQANAERPHRYKKPDIDGNKVSGKFWHTDSKPLFKLKEKHLPSSTEREYRKEKINEVKNLIKDRKREIQEKIEHRRRQLAATKIRKEENKLKGNTYQVVKNPFLLLDNKCQED